MATNEQVVRDFIQAWPRLDVSELLTYFTEDGVYHNMPIGPVSGQTKLRPFISEFLKDWKATSWEIRNLVSSDNIVIAERVDRTRVGERTVELPCCGVFEMSGGKIKVWRDYFDMASYTKAVVG